MDEVEKIFKLVQRFEKDAHVILATHEASKSRIVVLENTYRQLGGISLLQDDLFRQALRCAENDLFRAAHVMAWAGTMDFIQEKLASDGFVKLKASRPNWVVSSVDDLREYSDFSIIEALKAMGVCTKTEMKALHGLLNKRNECAHPSNYYPNLNETLGYISEILQRIKTLQTKVI